MNDNIEILLPGFYYVTAKVGQKYLQNTVKDIIFFFSVIIS